MTFGEIKFDPKGRKWKITCEAHVRARVKRVFPRASKHAALSISLSDGVETARDLEWFLERYPMRLSADDAARLRASSMQHRAIETKIANLFAENVPLQLAALAEPPRAYQQLAAELLHAKGSLLLADDVGLGKTVTTICSLVNPEYLPAVVVCPTHLPKQWQAMIGRFAPMLNTYVAKSGKPVETNADVLLINYHKLRGWAEYLAGRARFVAFDECQQLRNNGSEIYSAARLLSRATPRRLGLSATPIYNYGSEFFWVVDALSPGVLGEHEEFLREWCTYGGEKARLKEPKEFGSWLRREGIMLRRTRADVGRELPALTKVVHTVDADPKALEAIKTDAANLAKLVLAHNEQFRGERMQASGEFESIMRQATGIAKAPYVAEFVRLLLESEQRIVIFGWHRDVYSIWMEHLKEFNPVLYTGTESPSQKQTSIDRFTNGDARVLLMSLRSGAGVDGLQGTCRTVVFGELDWSPGVHEQCMGRVHRDGQDEACIAYYLVSEDGCDPIMLDVLGVKREQIESVRSPNTALAERIDTGENNIKRLAREFLQRRNIALPEPELVEV